jgi:hypothetical protein
LSGAAFQPPAPLPYEGTLVPLLLPGTRGRRTVPISIVWDVYAPNNSVSINLRQQQIGYLDNIQTIYADNTHSTVSTFLFFQDTQQIISIPAFGSMYIPALTGQLALIAWTVNPAATDITRLNLMNFEVQPISTVINTSATAPQSNPVANPSSPVTMLLPANTILNTPISPSGMVGTLTSLLLNLTSISGVTPASNLSFEIKDSTFTTALYGPINLTGKVPAGPRQGTVTMINSGVLSISYTNGFGATLISSGATGGADFTYVLSFTG